MIFRAAIFDVYGTLLEVGPPAEDPKAFWDKTWQQTFGGNPRLSHGEFTNACAALIQKEHEVARRACISWPEVNISGIARQVVPELTALPNQQQEDFFCRYMMTVHSTRMNQEAANTLRELQNRHCLLGIASNSQAYTLKELERAMNAHRLSTGIFLPELCFWSFANGFSKPNPHVFRVLSSRLLMQGVNAAQTVMIGDRKDNDIEPARAQGWQSWHLLNRDQGGDGGWDELLAEIRAAR